MASKGDSGSVGSVNALARRLRRAASTVHGWVRRADWPVGRMPPWSGGDVRKVLRWSSGLQEDRSGKGDNGGREEGSPLEDDVRFRRAERAAKLKLLMARAALAERQKQQLDDLYVTREFHRGELIRRATMFKAAFERLGKAVELRLDELDAETRRLVGGVIEDQARLFLTEIVRGIRAQQQKAGGGADTEA